MKMKNGFPVDLESLSSKDREKAIEELENERTALTKKIEALMADYAKASGNKKLRRTEKIGTAPNDYDRSKTR